MGIHICLQGLQAREIPASMSWSSHRAPFLQICSIYYWDELWSSRFLCSALPYSAFACQGKQPCLEMKAFILSVLNPVFAGGNQTVPWNTPGIPRTACLALVSLGFLYSPAAFFLTTKSITWNWSRLLAPCKGTSSPKCPLDYLRPSACFSIQSSHTSHSSLLWCRELSLLRGNHVSLPSN